MNHSSLRTCSVIASLASSIFAPAQDCTSVWTSTQAPSPPTNAVLALLPYNDGAGDALMVGSNSGLRRWDGQEWSAIGASTYRISSLAVLEENGQPVLYAGHQDPAVVRDNSCGEMEMS